MKIKIAFLWPYNNQWIGWWDRKFSIYYKNLSEDLFEKYFVYVVHDMTLISTENHNEIFLTEEGLEDFFASKDIDYIYFAWAKISEYSKESLLKKYYGLINVNFTDCYTDNKKLLNLIISKTDYWKIKWIHGKLNNSYVVYNPIDFENRVRLSKETNENHRSYFNNKKRIIGRLGRAEPSKWHYFIVATLLKLQKQWNYSYGFAFAGMPYLYRRMLKFLLNKKMYKSILFLPELRKLEDIANFYQSIDIFRQTSWIWESFWNVIAEAFCFNVPVITDFKAFYRNGKVNKKLYDAQIELVDNEMNWWYCVYPDSVIGFLENHSLDQLHAMWKVGYQKVQNVYNVKFTSNTMAKILYDFWKKHLSFVDDEKFENLVQIPWLKEVDDYREEYLKRIEICYDYNPIFLSKKILYVFSAYIWRSLEYIYLIYRKFAKNVLKKNIEK